MYDPNSINGEKPHFGPNLGMLGPNLGWQFFFSSKNLAASVTRYHGQLSSHTISGKIMIQSCENLVIDRQMDRWTRVIS